MLFVKGFDGNMDMVGYLTFPVAEETIAIATNLPREITHWNKHLFLPRSSHNFTLKPYFQHVARTKGFHREWIKPEYLNPMTIIIRLITYEGKFTVFKVFFLCLPAYFVSQKFLNFPFYFLKSLEKCQVKLGRIQSILWVVCTTTA